MLLLEAADTISGDSDTATAITYTIYASEVTSSATSYKKVAQGQLPDSIGTLYTVAASTSALVKSIHLVNSTGSAATAQLNHDGTTAATMILPPVSIDAGGWAVYDDDGWKFYTAQGQIKTVNATAGAPSTVDYLVGTSSGDLSAEIVAGTAPGGELGGTWASPTVDATHSGSTHSAATDTHIADTSDAHDASAISVDSTTLVGTGTDVQAVLEELDDGVANHLADTSDAHDASAVSVDSTTLAGTGTDVQAVFEEMDDDIAALKAVDYLVGTATGTLSGEIAVGTTPGGELGNTWASPTVDTTHAGSPHRTLAANNSWPNIAAAQTALIGIHPGNAIGSQTQNIMPYAGSVVGITVDSNEARTAGSCTFEVYIGGAATGLTAVIDGTNTRYHYGVQAIGLDTFAAGALVEARVTSTADWTPTTADLNAWVWVVWSA